MILSEYHTDKESKHKYFSEFYDKQFAKWRDKKLNLLEIGIDTGGSLQLWKDYFPNANLITGVDLNLDKCVNYCIDGLYEADAYSLPLVKFPVKFDIIIDDGSHNLDDIHFLLGNYIEVLNIPGILIIEDIPDISWPRTFGRFGHTVDLRKKTGYSDSILFYLCR